MIYTPVSNNLLLIIITDPSISFFIYANRVWQEWEIENNTFTAMRMVEGDDCGDKQRSVRVRIFCLVK